MEEVSNRRCEVDAKDAKNYRIIIELWAIDKETEERSSAGRPRMTEEA